MAKKKVPPRFYFAAFIVFLPQCISFLFTNSLESWVTNWWNTSQSENFLNAIEEKSMIEKFLELEDLILFDEIIKEYSETHQQNLRLGIHTAIIQLSKIHNKERIHTILHFSTNITSFVILIAYSLLGKKELVIINSWAQDFLYNLNDTTKALCIIFVVDFFLGYHSIRGWDLIISSVYKDFLGFIPNDQILLCLHSLLPVFLDSIFKYWVFFYLNRVSPSLVGIYHAINK